jgi:hypothetical protein
MGIVDKKPNSSPGNSGEEFTLDKIEIEYLLDLIKNSSFPGTHLEMLYTVVYKLQQQYLSKK